MIQEINNLCYFMLASCVSVFLFVKRCGSKFCFHTFELLPPHL
ncbi:hypothetical protein HMPREF2141_00747 [Bacteroides uniformis]|nr:hypothetical protein HMPREF2141_00747 [Bacteroides uniformis]